MHGEVSTVEVDVAPAKTEELAAPNAGVRRESERREQPLAARNLKKGVQLLGCPRSHLVARSASLRCFRVRGDVANDETAFAGVAQGLVQDAVHLKNRLRVEAALADAPTAREQVRVVRLEMVSAKASQREPTDTRNHVQLHDASVAVPGAWPEVDALCWEPRIEEVPAEAEADASLIRLRSAATTTASRSAAARSAPAACHLRRSRSVIGSTPS
jgi:hypothetical protein